MIGFIALCQSRSSKTKRGILRYPASVLAPESALGSLPSVALSSAQAIHILIRDAKPAVALVAIEGVEHLVPNVCTVAGFEVITIGRFCGDNRGQFKTTGKSSVTPNNGATNQRSGVYRNVCCGKEIVIPEGATFPDCPNHSRLLTVWKAIDVDVEDMIALDKESKDEPAA